MPLPEPVWFDPLWKAGALVLGAWTALKLSVSKKAVSEEKITATITLVNSHDLKIRALEDANRDTNAKMNTIDKRTEKTDDTVSEVRDTTNQILGELRAQRK